MSGVKSVTLTAGSGPDAQSVTMTPEQFDRAVGLIAGPRVPGEEEFGEKEFLEADEVERIAQRLIGEHARLRWLASLDIAFLWRKKGGLSKGAAVYGKCVKPSGLAKHYADVHFAVWIAADHVREAEFSARQLEALVYHELLHCGQDEETGNLQIVGHDFEGFRAEVEEYGWWNEGLRQVRAAAKQLGLGLDE